MPESGRTTSLGCTAFQGLAEIDPLVAAGTVPVGRDVVAADELDLAVVTARCASVFDIW